MCAFDHQQVPTDGDLTQTSELPLCPGVGRNDAEEDVTINIPLDVRTGPWPELCCAVCVFFFRFCVPISFSTPAD